MGRLSPSKPREASAPIKHAHDESSCSRHLLKKKKETPKRDKTTPGNREWDWLWAPLFFLGRGAAHTKEPARLCAGTMTGTAPARARLEGGSDPTGAVAGSWWRRGVPLTAGGERLGGRPPARAGGPR